MKKKEKIKMLKRKVQILEHYIKNEDNHPKRTWNLLAAECDIIIKEIDNR